jgi:hypothetical protein
VSVFNGSAVSYVRYGMTGAATRCQHCTANTTNSLVNYVTTDADWATYDIVHAPSGACGCCCGDVSDAVTHNTIINWTTLLPSTVRRAADNVKESLRRHLDKLSQPFGKATLIKVFKRGLGSSMYFFARIMRATWRQCINETVRIQMASSPRIWDCTRR